MKSIHSGRLIQRYSLSFLLFARVGNSSCGRSSLSDPTLSFLCIGLTKSDLSFQGEIPVDENSCPIGVRVPVQQYQRSGARANPGFLLYLVGVQLGDRQALHGSPVDSPTEKAESKLPL